MAPYYKNVTIKFIFDWYQDCHLLNNINTRAMRSINFFEKVYKKFEKFELKERRIGNCTKADEVC